MKPTLKSIHSIAVGPGHIGDPFDDSLFARFLASKEVIKR
jgi:hypothetical protein